MRKNNTAAALAQQLAGVTITRASVNTTNPNANVRNLTRCVSELQEGMGFLSIQPDRSLTVYIAPGQKLSPAFRRFIETSRSLLAASAKECSRIEFEFSSTPHELFRASDDMPEDYHSSQLRWAFHSSQNVTIAVTKEGKKPHLVTSPIQTVVRCNEPQVATWAQYILRRFVKRKTQTVVRMAPEVAS